jgi:hypothetical protein
LFDIEDKIYKLIGYKEVIVKSDEEWVIFQYINIQIILSVNNLILFFIEYFIHNILIIFFFIFFE